MLNSIKALKSYCKVTLSVFKKKIMMMTKKSYLYDNFFVSNKNFTTEHVKLLKIQGFFQIFCPKIQVFPVFFFKISKTLGFSRFPSQVANLNKN